MGKHTILVVDSNFESCRFLLEDLLHDGFEVVSFQHGAAAIEHASSNAIDLIIVDRVLDDIDSIKLIEQIRQHDRLNAIPIVFISSLDDRDDVIASLDAGVSDYVRKPYYYPTLAARIRNLIKIKHYQEQLVHARDEALSAKQSKSMLLANMSHEIRTPLNGIIGLSSLLEDTELNSTQSYYMNTLKTSAQLLLELINNLLDYGKFEQNQIQLEAIPFNIREMTDAIIAVLQPTINDKALAVSTDVDSSVSQDYIGDPGRLRQVLLNLMSNAIKFTREGHITIRIERLQRLSDSDRLKISVTDTGIGMTETELQNLFIPYSQANAAIQRHFGGTGLGLVISNQIVRLFGSRIEVTSEQNVGSTFSFIIDLVRAATTEVLRSDNSSLAWQDSTSGMFLNKAILVVEDNKTNQLVISAYLKSTDAEVTVVENGEECLQVLQKKAFDLILMDCQLHVLDGFETTEIIRTRTDFQSIATIPIIAMTANALSGDEAHCLAAGMNAYLTKPLDSSALIQQLCEYLN